MTGITTIDESEQDRLALQLFVAVDRQAERSKPAMTEIDRLLKRGADPQRVVNNECLMANILDMDTYFHASGRARIAAKLIKEGGANPLLFPQAFTGLMGQCDTAVVGIIGAMVAREYAGTGCRDKQGLNVLYMMAEHDRQGLSRQLSNDSSWSDLRAPSAWIHPAWVTQVDDKAGNLAYHLWSIIDRKTRDGALAFGEDRQIWVTTERLFRDGVDFHWRAPDGKSAADMMEDCITRGSDMATPDLPHHEEAMKAILAERARLVLEHGTRPSQGQKNRTMRI